MNAMEAVKIIFSGIANGAVQGIFALQIALMDQYFKALGISRKISPFIWICESITGFMIQPIVSNSRYGRRKIFISIGCVMISISVIIISLSVDIRYNSENYRIYEGPQWRAAIVYLIGLYILNLSKYIVQGSTQAFMTDLSGHHGSKTANTIFALWVTVGNISGYVFGASGKWHNENFKYMHWSRWFPGANLVALVFLLSCLIVTLIVGKEVPASMTTERIDVFTIIENIKNLQPRMLYIIFITFIIRVVISRGAGPSDVIDKKKNIFVFVLYSLFTFLSRIVELFILPGSQG